MNAPAKRWFSRGEAQDKSRPSTGVTARTLSQRGTPTGTTPTPDRYIAPTTPTPVPDLKADPNDFRWDLWAIDGDCPQTYKEALRVARECPPWTETSEPWCKDCDQCHRAHYTLTGLAACMWAPQWGYHDTSWVEPTRLWWHIWNSCPEALWGTSPDAMGRRMAREGWSTGWRGRAKVYRFANMPKVTGKPVDRYRRRTK